MRKKTTEEYIQEVALKNPSVEVLGQYSGNDKPIEHRCKVCGYKWLVRPHNVLYGTKCPECQKKVGKYHVRKTHDEYILELSKLNPDIKCLEEYKGANTKILHECLRCGKQWKAQPANILAGTSCPICSYKDMGERKKENTQSYVEKLKRINPDIYPLEEYTYSKEKILHECKVCGNRFMLDPNHSLQGVGCSYCNNAKRIQKRRKSQDEFVTQCQISSPTIKITGQYTGAFSPVEVECMICGYHWTPLAGNISQGHGCPACADVATSKRCRKTTDEYVSELKDKYPNISVKEEYKGADVPILHYCSDCNHEFYSRPANVLTYGCGKCVRPYAGEERIKEFLEEHNIPFVHPYRFSDLRGRKNPLSYDFYLPHHNRLIEFQGEQHERPVKYFGGEEHFGIQQKHDFLKRKYAFDHNIRLIEIWYYNYDRIEEILSQELNIESVETVTGA